MSLLGISLLNPGLVPLFFSEVLMHSKRKGFCFLELLVIAAIASVLLALTLPSIVNAQEEARQAQCKNNLKQFGLAMHNYHDVFRTLPPAWVAQKPDADEG